MREFARSKDGTSIPLNIVRRKGVVLNGSNPVLLNGYGGYNVSETPEFLGARTRLWLDGGGIFVIANLRGGGEFGESWHQQGALTHKQNVFDDFIAAAEHLIARRYTSPEHLAIIGGSNGGLLMGAAFTQRPELFTLSPCEKRQRVSRHIHGHGRDRRTRQSCALAQNDRTPASRHGFRQTHLSQHQHASSNARNK